MRTSTYYRAHDSMEDKENVPPAKKPRLPLSLKRNRFKKVSDKEVLSVKKGFVPNNTLRCNKWALNQVVAG